MQRARRSCKTTLFAVLVMAAMSGGTALAQPAETAWEFGGYVLDSLYANGTGIKDAIGYGVRGGYMFGGKHELGLSYDQATGDSVRAAVSDVDVSKIAFNYVRNFQMRNKENIFPIAIFGLGLISTDDGARTESSVFYKAGGGVRYYMTKRLALRFDGNIYRWDGDGKVVPVDSYFSFDFVLGLSFVTGTGS